MERKGGAGVLLTQRIKVRQRGVELEGEVVSCFELEIWEGEGLEGEGGAGEVGEEGKKGKETLKLEI